MRRRPTALCLLTTVALAMGTLAPAGVAAEEPPQPDRWTEVTFDVFTVDRVYLDKYGGITAEGRIACSPWTPVPDDVWIVASIQWDAIQYAGKRTAITAEYDSARASQCWMRNGGSDPYTWQTYPRVTPQEGVQWVYSTNGKFGSGTIHFDAQANGGYTVVRQHFDPSGASGTYDATCDDLNGDGYCIDEVFYNTVAQVNLKPIRLR